MPRLRMSDAEKKTARKLRRMGLKAATAREWTFHAERANDDGESLCLHRPHLRRQRLAPVIEVLKSCVVVDAEGQK